MQAIQRNYEGKGGEGGGRAGGGEKVVLEFGEVLSAGGYRGQVEGEVAGTGDP